jgi:hypothetical protein
MPRTNPWDEARKLKLTRGNEIWPPDVIDPGVNYFVLRLEEMGCTTRFSCEGHPDGFYVSYWGPLAVSPWIARISPFEVGVRHHSRWGSNFKMHLGNIEFAHLRSGRTWDDAARVKLLRAAARNWERWLEKAPPVPLKPPIRGERAEFIGVDEFHPTISEAALRTLGSTMSPKGPGL